MIRWKMIELELSQALQAIRCQHRGCPARYAIRESPKEDAWSYDVVADHLFNMFISLEKG